MSLYCATRYLVPAASLMLLSGLVQLPAHAGAWFAVEGTSVTIDRAAPDSDINPTGLRFRMGTPIAPRVDVEGHLGFSGTDETDNEESFGTVVTAAYLKGYLPVGYNSALFAQGGFANVTLSQTVDGREFDDSRSGFSFGFGMETRLTERLDLTADYISYSSGEGLFEDISAVNFGIKLYF